MQESVPRPFIERWAASAVSGLDNAKIDHNLSDMMFLQHGVPMTRYTLIAMLIVSSGCSVATNGLGDGSDGAADPPDGGIVGDGGAACVSGMTVACTCADGRPGAASCVADGSRFGACACSGPVDAGPPDLGSTACVPGASLSCTCTDGSSGSQACAADGSGYDACACDGFDAGPPPVCPPGYTEACVCTDGSSGVQVCRGDGSGYDACTSCGGAVDAGPPDAGPAPDAGPVDGSPCGSGGVTENGHCYYLCSGTSTNIVWWTDAAGQTSAEAAMVALHAPMGAGHTFTALYCPTSGSPGSTGCPSPSSWAWAGHPGASVAAVTWLTGWVGVPYYAALYSTGMSPTLRNPGSDAWLCED